MGRSQKWPDLRSPISKIRDIRFVGTDDLIIFRKFHNFPWNIEAVARWESYFVVGSLDLTWWPDLTWPWVKIFTKVAEKMGGKVGENPAALRAAVFSLSSKNLRGGGVQTPPPSRARVNKQSEDIIHLKIHRIYNRSHRPCNVPTQHLAIWTFVVSKLLLIRDGAIAAEYCHFWLPESLPSYMTLA